MVVGLGGVPPPLSMICSPNKRVVLLPLSLKNPDPTDRGFDKQSRSQKYPPGVFFHGLTDFMTD